MYNPAAIIATTSTTTTIIIINFSSRSTLQLSTNARQSHHTSTISRQ